MAPLNATNVAKIDSKPTHIGKDRGNHGEIPNNEMLASPDQMTSDHLPEERLSELKSEQNLEPAGEDDGDDEETSEILSYSDISPEISRPQKGYSGDSKPLMQRFTLYETASRFYLVGQDITERHFRILKIDRTVAPGQLGIFEDENEYDKESIRELLATIEDGNKGSGGLKTRCTAWGLLGFIRFTEAYYMVLITKRAQAAMIGGHYLYQIESTELIALTTGSSSRFQRDRNPEEARYLGIFANIDLTKSLYFSYSYNITRTLQANISNARQALKDGHTYIPHDWNDMFVWNHHLLEPAEEALNHVYDWCIPIVYGYIDQAALDVLGRRVYITLIARRSRFFAGARYLKRGANDRGYVANDVETEQIVSDLVTTSFHGPGQRLFSNPNYTSYVQHRGSIPLYWSQDNSGVTPKPDIEMNLVDPYYSAAALHFDNLFQRYGGPVYVLNLIKARERTPRESKLLQEYQKALAFLNQSLPEDKKILYRAFDMSRAAKTRGQDVIGVLELIAEDIMNNTGFFQNGDYETSIPQMQNGVARTNCIDCLDRTNAAQFVIGKRALGHQLHALGVISGYAVDYDTDAVNTFTHMFHAHGDTIAIQYGGSHLAHTMATYRKINEWKNHSRDVVESFKRYYHNSFLDSQRQEAFNLFLGNYIYSQGQPMLWDLASDYYLHHSDPRLFKSYKPPHYINWYTPAYFEPRVLPDTRHIEGPATSTTAADEYWLEYYRPLAITSFAKTFSYKISSRPRYLPELSTQEIEISPSPFIPRNVALTEAHELSAEKKQRKGHVMIVEPPTTQPTSSQNGTIQIKETSKIDDSFPNGTSEMKMSDWPTASSTTRLLTDRSQWTIKQWYENLLDPTVVEEDEYVKYVEYPLNQPLVTGTEELDISGNREFVNYLARGDGLGPAMSQVPTLDNLAQYQDDVEEMDDALFGEMDPESLADYAEFLSIVNDPEPLTVTEGDDLKKRYKAYRQWLKGRSFFKLSKLDPEWRAEN